jgi:hypothetical protein
MTTVTITAVSEDQAKKWAEAVQEFVNDIDKKYPGISGSFVGPLIEEVKALGLHQSFISSRSLWACFRNAVADGRIVLPKLDVAEASERLAAAFPPVVTERQLARQKRDAAANAGIAAQSGRVTSRDRREADSQSSKDVSIVRNLSRLAELKAEYKSLRVKCETAMGSNPRNHSETFSLRKKMLSELQSNPRFAEVRSE